MYTKFERLLKENNTTAYQVSKETGVSASTFTDWKSGRSAPKVEKLQKISKYFNLPVNYFLEN